MTRADDFTRFLYWLKPQNVASVRRRLQAAGRRIATAKLSQCEVLRAKDDTVWIAGPEVFSRVCARQGSWYRDSTRAGQTMLVSARRLPAAFDRFLDAELSASDFEPNVLPAPEELAALVDSTEYRSRRPDAWEKVRWWEAIFIKLFFTITRAWGRGENLKRHWLGHRANHANFLAKHHTTELDGEQVAYSVTENAGVCSSCVEFFNLIEPDSRKLVRSCPGSISLAGAPKDVYVDVKPVRRKT